MSTVTSISANQSLAQWARNLAEMYAKDLAALTPDQYTTSIGGKCRTAQSVTEEVVGFLGKITAQINGAEPTQGEAASIATPEAGQEAIKAAADEIATALENASDEKLSSEVTAPWGQPMQLFVFAQIAVNHIWYHDGQINMIQSFNGDEEIHWM